MGAEDRGSQGTVTKEPSPWSLHLTPAHWVLGCQGLSSENGTHGLPQSQRPGSNFCPLAYSPPDSSLPLPSPRLPPTGLQPELVPSPAVMMTWQYWTRTLTPVLPALGPSSSPGPSPPRIGGLGPVSTLSHPSLSPGLCTHMRMAQMTSSLQHQEVRIPAIPLPFSPPPPPVVFFPTLLALGHLPACSQPTHTCLPVSFLQPSQRSSGWGGREPCLFFDYEKTELQRRRVTCPKSHS